MNKEICITVVTICYNSEKYIEETILSVINQSYSNFEYIVIDGGSTDGTIGIIKKFESNIDSWISEKDNGISDAFNKGISLSHGEWIIFINSGDKFASDSVLEIVYPQLVENKTSDIICGKIDLYRSDGSKIKSYGGVYNRKQFEIENTVPHQAIFHSKDYFLKYGLFDENYKYAMDYELMLRKNNIHIYFIDTVISIMLAGGKSQSNLRSVCIEFFTAKEKWLKKHKIMLYFEYWYSISKYYVSSIKNNIK